MNEAKRQAALAALADKERKQIEWVEERIDNIAESLTDLLYMALIQGNSKEQINQIIDEALSLHKEAWEATGMAQQHIKSLAQRILALAIEKGKEDHFELFYEVEGYA